jgi:hypothetical protein
MTVSLIVVRGNYLNLKIYTIEEYLSFQYLEKMHCCLDDFFSQLYPALASLNVHLLVSSFSFVEFSCHNLFMNTKNI